MLEGLLVDLVPHGERFRALEHKWENGEAAFWGDIGDRQFLSKAVIESRQKERAEHRARESNPAVVFGIQAKDATPLGLFVIAMIQPQHGLAMLGAMIGEPEYWGGGYGTDALLLAVDFAFDWLDMRKLWLMTMSPNVRVMRQMDKVGFTLESRRRAFTWVDGAWHDLLIYGLLREEWPCRASMIEKLGLRAQGG